MQSSALPKKSFCPNGKQLKVKIPKGSKRAPSYCFKGYGEPGTRSGTTGDAYVEIHYKSSGRFTIEGDDLISELAVSLDEAINGAQIEFITVEGTISLKIPAGVSSGTKLKIKGKGLRWENKPVRGDQYVVISIKLPRHPDHELSQFIRTWAKNHPYHPRPERI